MKQSKLVKEAVQGNGHAFEKLLEIYSDRLYRTAYLYVGNREDALDVVQETVYKGFSSIGQLRNPKYFLTWLTKVLIRCAYEILEKKKTEVLQEYVVEPSQKQEPVNESHLDLVEAIGRLKENHRTAIILFYYHDLPIKEIADIMDAPENTVKTYLQRGKKGLKKVLGGTGYNGQEIVS